MARRNKARKRSESTDTVNTVNSTNGDPVPGPSQPTGHTTKKKKTDCGALSDVVVAADVAGGDGLQQLAPGAMSGITSDVPDGDQRVDVIADLVKKVTEQQATINRLTQQVDFLLSYLGISTNTESAVTASTTVNPAVGPGPVGVGGISMTSSTSQQQPVGDSAAAAPRPPTFADITARRPAPLSAAMKQAVVSAVYRDFEDRDRRNRNVVVSGIPRTEISDVVVVKRLLEDEYGRTYDVVKCRRLGRPTSGKTQPILVSLGSAAEAQYLVHNARQLRQSHDSQIRATIFINPDITRAEAFAAYQERCERRRRAASRPPREQQQTVADQPTVMELDALPASLSSLPASVQPPPPPPESASSPPPLPLSLPAPAVQQLAPMPHATVASSSQAQSLQLLSSSSLAAPGAAVGDRPSTD